MGLIMKKDDSEDNEYIDGIEDILSGEGPEPEENGPFVEIHDGLTAEDISGTVAARESERELEADPELLEDVDTDADDEDATDADAAAGIADGDTAGADVDGNRNTDQDADVSGDAAQAKPSAGGSGGFDRRHKLYIAIAIVAVIVAGVAGYEIGSGAFGPKGVDESFISEDQLDETVATWNMGGGANKVTARQAIESQYALDSVKLEDGTYPAPSSEMIVSYARNQVLLAEAEKQGISLDDDELKAAAEDTLGTSDFEAIAEQYQVEEAQAKEIVRDQVIIQKLYQTVVKDAPVMPAAPEEPEGGDENATSAEYAAYIIDLAGKEWDEKAGAWASEDGAYAQALAGEKFTADSASYAQAQKAYAVAYQTYATEAQSANQDWTAYVNKLFAKADITIYGMYA